MSYEELTPMARGRYDGSMDTNTPEQQHGKGEPFEEITPGPVTEAGRLLFARAKNGEHETEEPAIAQTSGESDMQKGHKAEGGKPKLTREVLVEVSQTVQRESNPQVVIKHANVVSSAARSLYHSLKDDKSEASMQILKKLGDNKLIEQAERLQRVVEGSRLSDHTNSAKEQRDRDVLSHAGEVARLAKEIANYYEAAKITLERDDPFKQITSFEELMTKFAKSQERADFRQGGEFQLIEVHERTDEFGRILIDEKAHPENFLRWVRERAYFYHDFDPMATIDIFKGMYIVAGSRTVPMYEMLVDFDIYFAHREPTYGELKVLSEDFYRAEEKGEFMFDPDYNPEKPKPGQTVGHYTKFKDPQGKPREAYIKYNPEVDEKRGAHVFAVYYKDENGNDVPINAVLANKDDWNTKPTAQTPEFNNAKEQILYEVWLLMKNHNMDVTYRQKGMPSEKPLSETLADLYSDNIWTRTRDRLLKMMNMPTTTHRDDDFKNNETTEMMGGTLEHQGSTGKAFQRSTAAYYHISEGNAPYAGYDLEEGRNPFKELLRKGDIDGAGIFYKSLLRQSLEKNLGYGKYDSEKNPHTANIASELIGLLNETRIPRKEGGTRARYDWEKAELIDIVLLGTESFLTEVAKHKITREDFAGVVRKLQMQYGELDENGKPNSMHSKEKLQQLQTLLTQSSADKKRGFNQLVEGKLGKGDDKDEKASKAFLGSGALDAYAISVFVRCFDKEYTPGINPYENIRYSLEGRDRMRQAMRDVLVQTERLDAFEAKYAEEWAFTFTYHSGISARNDMGGIGHDAWSKVLNTEFYRLRQTGGGNYPGNLDNLYGIHRLGADFWQGMKVKEDGHNKYDKTLYEELVGLEKHGSEYVFNINKNIASFEFAGNAMRQFYGDHVSHAIDLFIDLTQKQEFNIDKLVQRDNFGRLTWNNEEMQKMIDSTWKHLRYGFDNNGFLYDNTHYGWLYDETMGKDGQIKRTPRFGFKTMRELMFSEKVREMDMYSRKDVGSWSSEGGKMARNVFSYLIAAQLREHTRYSGGYRKYSADEVEMITMAFLNYAARVMQGEGGETVVLSGFFSPEEIMRILVTAHAVLWMLRLKEFGTGTAGGFLFGFFEAFGLIMKQLGAGIKL